MINFPTPFPYKLDVALAKAAYDVRQHLDNGVLTWVYDLTQEAAINSFIAAYNPLPVAQADAVQEINAAVDAVLAKIVAPYPPLEKDTWSIQVAEATAFTANNTVSTPMLSDIALHSGQTVAALAANVLNKLSVYRAACAVPIGQRINFTTQVYAASDWTLIAGVTAAALAAIGI